MDPQQKKTRQLDDAVALANQHLPGDTAAQLAAFIPLYYQRVIAADLAERRPGDLYGAALCHWHLLQQHRESEPQLRIYNPVLEEDGWQSTHTVIELVCDDQSFLVDSLRNAVNQQGLTIHLSIHPVLTVERDDHGHLSRLRESRHSNHSGQRASSGSDIALFHLEVDHRSEAETLQYLARVLRRVINDVTAAVQDWQPMRTSLQQVIDEIVALGKDIHDSLPGIDEQLAFLRWLADNRFTFLGYLCLELVQQDGDADPNQSAPPGAADELWELPDTGLGIDRNHGPRRLSREFMSLPPEVRAMARRRELLILTKADQLATVHRAVYMDYLGIRRFNPHGEVIGEHRFLGLYASPAYADSVQKIPLLRQRAKTLLERSDLRHNSHSAKALTHILETFPRDQMFHIPDADLTTITMGILHLEEHQRTRLFVSRDPFQRFFSCLLFVPRERYHTELRKRVQGLLREAFHAGSVEFTVQLSESLLARIHFIVHCPPGVGHDADLEALEEQVIEHVRSWNDELHAALLDGHGEEQGNYLYQRYQDAFDAAYRERYPATIATHDIDLLELLQESDRVPKQPPGCECLRMNLYHPAEVGGQLLRFKLFRRGQPIALSLALPILENMGVEVLEEHPFRIAPRDLPCISLHDFGLQPLTGQPVTDPQVKALFQDCFQQVWDGRVENDRFNRLVLMAQLNWRQISVLRAYSKYLKQTGFTFSQRYIGDTLAANANIAQLLSKLFEARLDPTRQSRSGTRVSTLVQRIDEALEAVASLDQDRILRRLLAVIQATLRSNYFQRDALGAEKPYLSFKLDPAAIPDMPLPRPRFEIYVCSPRTEGVHLRGGEVARGGLRWSDRPEDYRTEILGLMKAQVVKNAVIVPVGAKGGFIVKRPPAEGGREALQKELIACYQTFIRGLLDLTDNRVGERIVPPRDTVRHDHDDPYLVVAADKGTATFSDIANQISADYNFWLGDAFASGGSVGYDHKAMGITARGAWESVKRHFRELNHGLSRDIQQQPFTVAGIGDMSGDVFGNGMLQSPCIKLVAAFDHRHLFIDPDPDPTRSLTERQRLFKLTRSSWADYDRALLSEGGGIWPRSDKSITLSEQARRVLDTPRSRFTPQQLIQVILKAPVDLLWNGGIGTYIKSSAESHDAVGDRSNDALRVNADQLRCLVIGEGGNLGVTQAGRIQYARAGGRINTDFIDNAGGVDCSDHEVNIKILLNHAVANDDLTTKQRNQLLVSMTDSVTALVLRSNYQQSQCLSLVQAEGRRRYSDQVAMIRAMEKQGRLDRALEGLPDDEQLAERDQLSSPEVAVLVCYAKLSLFDQLAASNLHLDAYFIDELHRYFPPQLETGFGDNMARHRLAREIIATVTANDLINRMGGTFIYRLQELSGAAPEKITRAYVIAREIFTAKPLWRDIEALDNSIPAGVQTRMLLDLSRLLERATRRLLRQRLDATPVNETVEQLKTGVQRVAELLPDLLTPPDHNWYPQAVEHLITQGVEESLARRVAQLGPLVAAIDIVHIASDARQTVDTVTAVYFGLDQRLGLHWLHQQITALPSGDRWQKLSRNALREELYQGQRNITASILINAAGERDANIAIRDWQKHHHLCIAAWLELLQELQAGEQPDLAMLSVATRRLRQLMEDSAAAQR